MSIVNVGSINVDHVYRVAHFTEAGETQTALEYQVGLGGKGLNQSIAIVRAGGDVAHVGAIGRDDSWTPAELEKIGLDLSAVARVDAPTGHAIIEVDSEGENRIVIVGGANQTLRESAIEAALRVDGVNYLLTQSETNAVEQCFRLAKTHDIPLIFSPAPCDESLRELPLELAKYIVLNEIELMQLAGEDDFDRAVGALKSRCPSTNFVVTLGGDGVEFIGVEDTIVLPAEPVEPVDTTGAGDCFLGYFAAGLDIGLTHIEALERATQAAAIAVTRAGAVSAIPELKELS